MPIKDLFAQKIIDLNFLIISFLLASFMIVDTSADAIDIIIRTLLENNELGDISGRIEDPCGGNSVDEEFLNFLSRKVGQSAINLLKENHYGQLQYMIKDFCENCKFKFTGQDRDFSYELDFTGEKKI